MSKIEIMKEYCYSPTSVEAALVLINDPHFHKFWVCMWEEYLEVLKGYNAQLEQEHKDKYAGMAMEPCPVDLSNGLIPGSDDEWEYNQWVTRNQQPKLTLWSETSATTCPAWLDAHKSVPDSVRNIANTINGGNDWLGIMLMVKECAFEIDAQADAYEATQIISDMIPSIEQNFRRIAKNFYPEAWKQYQDELTAQELAKAKASEHQRESERLQAVAVASGAGYNGAELPLFNIETAEGRTNAMGYYASQMVALLEAAHSTPDESTGFSPADLAGIQDCILRLYASNSAQCADGKGVQLVCMWLATGRTPKNPLSPAAIRFVYATLMRSIEDASISNTAFADWFMRSLAKDAKGVKLHSAICKRIGFPVPSSVLMTLAQAPNIMDSL